MGILYGNDQLPGTPSVSVCDWKISLPDDSNDQETAPAGKWKKTSVPLLIKPDHCMPSKRCCLWLKGTFRVTGDPERVYGISLGRIYFNDATYINGALVNSTSWNEISNVHEPRNYMLQKGVVHKGVNTLLVKVGVPGDRYGGLADPVFVSGKNAFNKYKLKYELLYRQIPVAIIVFLAAGIIPLLVYFACHPREYVFLAGAAVSALHVAYVASFFSPLRIWDLESSVAVQLAHVPLFAMAMTMLIQSMYRVYLVSLNVVASGLLAVAAIIAMLSGRVFPAMTHKIIFAMALLAIISIFYAVSLARLHAVRPDRYRLAILIFFIVLMQAVIGFELATFITGLYPSGIVATYCIPFFNLLFSILAGIDIGKRFKEMKRKYDGIEVSLHGRERGISESTRDKLDRIIEFLNSNYREDVSREGLAGAVGMNHDYMSRQFKSYTGKKINEYINELRVREAVKKIEESEATILEVALSVGFESLSTFSRAFRKVTGRRPADLIRKNPR